MRDQRTRSQILILLCSVFLTGCGSSGGTSGEQLPLKVGDFFVYHDVADARLVMEERIELKQMSDASRRHYCQTGSVFFRKNPSDITPNNGSGRGYVIDLSGTILSLHDGSAFSSLGREQMQGRLIKLWLPTSKREVGKGVEFAGFPQPLKVVDRIEWKKWEVWRVSFRDHTFFYDVETGFLVGRQWEGQKWVLQDCSIPNLPTEQGD